MMLKSYFSEFNLKRVKIVFLQINQPFFDKADALTGCCMQSKRIANAMVWP